MREKWQVRRGWIKLHVMLDVLCCIITVVVALSPFASGQAAIAFSML